MEVAVPGFPEPRTIAPSTVLLTPHGAAVILMMVICYCKEQRMSPTLGPEMCSFSLGGSAGWWGRWRHMAKVCQVGKVWPEETQVGHLISHLHDYNFDQINESVTLP